MVKTLERLWQSFSCRAAEKGKGAVNLPLLLPLKDPQEELFDLRHDFPCSASV